MFKRTLFIASVLLLAASLAQAQTAATTARPPTGFIRGAVMFNSGVPAERAEVVIEKNSALVTRLYTNSNGNFEAFSLTPDTYDIRVRVDGYQEARQRVELISNAGLISSPIVNIFLDKNIEPVPEPDYTGQDMSVMSVEELNRRYPKKALQEYEKALEEDRKGKTTDAAHLLEDALKLAPDFSNAHNSLGSMYQKMERFSDAEKEFNRAHELSPNLIAPLLNLGSLYIQQADASRSGRRVVGRILDQALDILEQAIKLKPSSAMGFYLLGNANYKSAFYEEAETDLKRSLENDPRLGAAQIMLANLYIRQQKWQDALTEIDQYLSRNPKAENRAQVEATRLRVAGKLDADSAK